MMFKSYRLIAAFTILMLLSPIVAFSKDPNVEPQDKPNTKIRPVEEKKEKEKITRWEFGINFGAYFGNKYSANFYSGDEGNVNTISYVMSNKYWYQEIALLLHSSDTIIVTGIPENMHYTPAIIGGLFLRFNFNRHLGIFVEANYAKLKTDGEFTVEIDPASYPTYPNLQNFGVHGREERVSMDLGLHYKFPVYKNKLNLFAQAGINVNYVRVLKNYITFYDKEYSIINIYGSKNYVPNSNLQEYSNIQGGFGYGLYLGGGMGFTFTPQIGLELGGYLHYIRVDLENYNEFRPSGSIYLRFMLSNLINGEEE